MIDNEAFSILIKKYSPNMYRLSYGMLRSGADAEDAVSEAVLKAYENLGSLRKPERFQAWIMQITANEARKIYRRKQRITYVEDMAEVAPAFMDNHHELWDAVMGLEAIHREVVILYFYETLSVKEIAHILHVAEGTVKSRLSRGKKQLKKMLQ